MSKVKQLLKEGKVNEAQALDWKETLIELERVQKYLENSDSKK